MSHSLPVVEKASGLVPTDIEWADVAWNPLRAIGPDGRVGWACAKVSSGCANCYAEAINRRFGTRRPFTAAGMDGVRVVLDEQRVAAVLGARPRRPFKAPDGRPKVFVCDMNDLFGDWVPFQEIDRVFAVAALRPDMDFLLLTKRPERMGAYLRGGTRTRVFEAAMSMLRMYDRIGSVDLGNWPMRNVWLGTSVEHQASADERIPHLLRCKAAVRFLSVEPLLGDVDLRMGRSEGIPTDEEPFRERCDLLLQVIVGGESGPKARPCEVEWIRGVVRQCKAASVPCFVKQLGARPIVYHDEANGIVAAGGDVRWDDSGERVSATLRLRDRKGGDMAEWPEDLRVREWPEVRRG